MTRKEFEKLRLSIEEQGFFGQYANPIEYGIRRAQFEKKKLQQLIAMARNLNFRTTRAKAKQWQRQLEKAELSCERFKELQKEIAGSKLHVQLGTETSAKAKFQLRP